MKILALETANEQCSVAIVDAQQLLYFQSNDEPRKQTQLILPMIEQVTQSSGLAQQYNNFAGQAANFGVIDAKDASIENYVAEQALDGLFTIIAEQEASIRQTPAQAASDIAKKVFGLIR